MLIITDTIVKTLGHNLVKPSEYLRPIAQATSNNPAIKSISQAILQ
jgi:hypothetical protein